MLSTVVMILNTESCNGIISRDKLILALEDPEQDLNES